MDSKEFIAIAIKEIIKYFNEKADATNNYKLTAKDVFVVWSCKTLQNNKALLSTCISDGMYYEVTYNEDKKEIYLDAYKKWENKAIKLEVEGGKE